MQRVNPSAAEQDINEFRNEYWVPCPRLRFGVRKAQYEKVLDRFAVKTHNQLVKRWGPRWDVLGLAQGNTPGSLFLHIKRHTPLRVLPHNVIPDEEKLRGSLEEIATLQTDPTITEEQAKADSDKDSAEILAEEMAFDRDVQAYALANEDKDDTK